MSSQDGRKHILEVLGHQLVERLYVDVGGVDEAVVGTQYCLLRTVRS
jgi:hypothetical protein